MFWHNLKYEFLQGIRQKEQIGWMMIFPIVLATFFYLAFGNLYEQDELFCEIPVAVVELKEDAVFSSVMEELAQGEDPLFTVQYTEQEAAEALLRDGEIDGIILVDETLSMVAKENCTEASIIHAFLSQYHTQKTVITDTMKTNPQHVGAVTESLSAEIRALDTRSMSNGNMDLYASYFHNLIAMVALFAATGGVFAATQNQGNLSPIGARKCTSPTHKLKSIISSLLATFLCQTICTFLSITYIALILRVDMGNNIPMLYLSGAIGVLAGTALGFFIGSIGTLAENTKFGIAFAFTMVCCFLSGLMVGNMKPLFEQHCPIVNRLNPAALISDLFYCLTIYDNYTRYTQIALTLIVMSVIFTAGGFLFTRRKKYASI